MGFRQFQKKEWFHACATLLNIPALEGVPGHFLDYGLSVFFFQFGPGKELVSVIDIGLVVLVVVKVEGLCADIGFERVFRKRQIGQCERPYFFSF